MVWGFTLQPLRILNPHQLPNICHFLTKLLGTPSVHFWEFTECLCPVKFSGICIWAHKTQRVRSTRVWKAKVTTRNKNVNRTKTTILINTCIKGKCLLTPGCFIFWMANLSRYDNCSIVSIVMALLWVSMHSATVIFCKSKSHKYPVRKEYYDPVYSFPFPNFPVTSHIQNDPHLNETSCFTWWGLQSTWPGGWICG